MGLYTVYTLNTMENKYKISDIISYMKEQYNASGEHKYYAFNDYFDFDIGNESTTDFDLPGDDCYWCDYDEEMIELSERFPETVFCLYGNGQGTDDFWYTYYKNGKSQFCPAQIVFDEYDESKLI